MFKKLLVIFIAQLTIIATMDIRIIGGKPAKVGEFPYQVSVRYSSSDRHFCGGVLITPKHVLTAAHCCYSSWLGVKPATSIIVVFGQVNLGTNNSTIGRNVSKIILHPQYVHAKTVNDIAIMELVNEVFLDGITPSSKAVASGASCVVSGWGVTNTSLDTLSQQLLATEVFVVEHKKCQKMYGAIGVALYDGMLCAGNEKRASDACQGDSGGPLVCEGRLIGIVSTGVGCANKNFPGIYSDVFYYLPWIEKETGYNFTENLNSFSKFLKDLKKVVSIFLLTLTFFLRMAE